jgi:hypothetical protein
MLAMPGNLPSMARKLSGKFPTDLYKLPFQRNSTLYDTYYLQPQNPRRPEPETLP